MKKQIEYLEYVFDKKIDHMPGSVQLILHFQPLISAYYVKHHEFNGIPTIYQSVEQMKIFIKPILDDYYSMDETSFILTHGKDPFGLNSFENKIDEILKDIVSNKPMTS